MMASTDKIGPQHLGRPAVVYVRQSTISQVRHHHESRRRQYDLAARAKQLGWREVSVIDEDLGRSGASSAGRTGFKHLVAETGLGHIGAIFAIEVSRLARNNRDWYQLLDLCGLMDTLIIDDEGIYNTRQPNDRLLLGLKGTISEAELGWIRQRAQQGLLSKARRGELVLGLPVGYVKAPGGRIEKAPMRAYEKQSNWSFANSPSWGVCASATLAGTRAWHRPAGELAPSGLQHHPQDALQSDLCRGLCLRPHRDSYARG